MADSSRESRIWAAAWTTPINAAFLKMDMPPDAPAIWTAYYRQPELEFALPDAKATSQTLRVIVKPDVWSDTIRVRFSNVFGDQPLSIGAAAVAVQEYGGHVLSGTSLRLAFNGKLGVAVPVGAEIFSDPVHLAFVTPNHRPLLEGRNLAVSFFISSQSGRLGVHGSRITSYLGRPNSGDHTQDLDDAAFPYTTNNFFVVNAVDVLAKPGTAVVCALGDSITDGGFTPNGNDGWSDALSHRVHQRFGDRVSVVNMAIGGNTVVTEEKNALSESVVERLQRDVLGISGLSAVVWLQGINDLGSGRNTPEAVIEGYKQVVARLHQSGVTVVGATLTSSVWPHPPYDKSPLGAILGEQYGSPQTNAHRHRLNDFIRTSGLFDSVADMDRATEDPATGALYKDFQIGSDDYLHPTRAGHLAMAESIDLSALYPIRPPPEPQSR